MAEGNKDTGLGLGERLRSARKARALTLEQAAVSIRLEASVLRALEDERYEVLGAAVFVRGHLKAYAKLLGLSEETVMKAYRAADPNADAPPKVTRELEKPLTTTPGPVAIAAAVALAIVAMLLLYLLSGGKEPARETVRLPNPSATVETVPTLGPAPSVTTTPGVDTAAAPGPSPVPSPVPSPGPTPTTAPAEVAPAVPAPAAATTPAPAANFE
jgi:cytoskeleton protein RodZ